MHVIYEFEKLCIEFLEKQIIFYQFGGHGGKCPFNLVFTNRFFPNSSFSQMLFFSEAHFVSLTTLQRNDSVVENIQLE